MTVRSRRIWGIGLCSILLKGPEEAELFSLLRFELFPFSPVFSYLPYF